VRTIGQCVEAGLIDGHKLHVDSSLIDANAAKESVIKGAPELIAALKRAYQATERKLEAVTTPESYEAVNDRMMSVSDPDAAMVRRGGGDSRPRYHHPVRLMTAKGDHGGGDDSWERDGEREALGVDRAHTNQYGKQSRDGGR
jgi:hypothetical protein